MAVYYFDTSALVKRYANERGTGWMVNLINPTANHKLYTVRITGPEMIAAFFRKANTGQIPRSDAVIFAQNFKANWQNIYRIIEIDSQVSDNAMLMAEKHGLRGYDAVHLATAIHLELIRHNRGLPRLIFVSADNDLFQTAQSEGLLVENPNNYP
ncbi:type II toxin-antitoxin system VapC family toxin [Anaerolineales bacterium HSG6]|nr:type II toxin-antitoxin system VapC family toxin [Anaerolineales bacterium HSG6]